MPAKKKEATEDTQRTSDDKRQEFIRAPIKGDLVEVNGIADRNAAILAENGVTNTFQLIGKFLALTPDTKDGKTNCKEHCDNFYLWLKEIGLNNNKADIIQSIAEKMDCTFNGIYDETKWSEEEGKEAAS